MSGYFSSYDYDYNRQANDQDYNRHILPDLTDYHSEVVLGMRSLEDVPEDEITKSMCYNAVSNDRTELRFIPGALLDDVLIELCLELHDQNYWNCVLEMLRDIEPNVVDEFIRTHS